MDLRQPKVEYKPVKKKKKHYLRNFLVVFFALILTTLAVNATDNIGNFSNSILGSAIGGVLPEKDVCEKGMVLVSSPEKDFCIDKYEVSAGNGCSYLNPKSVNESHENISNSSCKLVSEEGKIPWTNISQNQAVEACAKMGKHLPSNLEWFLGSLGTPDVKTSWSQDDCNIDQNWDGNSSGKTGTGGNCKSAAGAYDMIGNVWEWTFETVNKGNYRNTELPDGGFVQGVNSEGLPIETGDNPNNLYYFDRFWIDKTITTGIFRGGYWRSVTDAGRFSVHSEIPPSFSGDAVGFRCAK